MANASDGRLSQINKGPAPEKGLRHRPPTLRPRGLEKIKERNKLCFHFMFDTLQECCGLHMIEFTDECRSAKRLRHCS